MADEIKSAFEKAMEKVADLGRPTPEQRLEWDGVPKGQRAAGAFLNRKGDLAAEVQACEAPLRRYVVRGALEVLAANIQLPRSPGAEASALRALEGIRVLLKGKPRLDEMLGQVKYVAEQFKTHGEQQRQQVYAQLREQFQGQVQQALARQGAAARQPVNVEGMPEFQQEWGRVRAQLDQQFETHMQDFRQRIQAMA